MDESKQFVYLLYHTHTPGQQVVDINDENHKMLGVFSSKEKAERYIQEAVLLPGFRDYPDGFLIDTTLVDQPDWPEGFEEMTDEENHAMWNNYEKETEA